MKIKSSVVKNTNNEEHALDLVTGSHNAPPKHSKVKLSAKVSLDIHPTKPDENNTENVRRSRQKNPVDSVVLSSFGKEKTSNFKEVSDKDRRAVCKRDAHVTARETRPGAGQAKNELNCRETEVLDKSFKRENVGIAAIPDLTYETNDMLSDSNEPEEGGIQVCTSIPEDLIDLKKVAANPSEEFEISSKACSDNSSKNLGKEDGNVKELNPVNLHSTNDISSAKSCDTLFSTTGSAEGPSISPRDAPLCENFRAVEAEISSVAVIQTVSCHSNADNSTFGNDVVSVCLELTKEDGLLFESASNCAHRVLEDCSWENSAPSKSRPISDCAASEPISDSIGGISPALAKMMLTESFKAGEQTSRSRLTVSIGESLGSNSPISVRMISDVQGAIDNNVAAGRTSPVSKEMGPAGDNLGEIQFTIDNEICSINTGIAKSDLESRPSSSADTSLGEVNDQGKLYTRVNEVKNNFCFEENITPPELPAESQFIAEEGRTSPVSKEMGPDGDNLGEIQFTIDNEICSNNTGIAKSDLKSRPSSSIDTSLGEVNDQGKLYTRVNEVTNNFCFEENITPQELPAESQFIAEEGNEHTSKHSGNTALTSARMASDKGVNKEKLGSTSPDLTNTESTEGLECNSWYNKAVLGESSLPKEVKRKDKEENNDQMADSLQVLNEGTQFDRVTMVADISFRDNQVGPLLLSSVDVPGNTLPVEVCKMKQRRPRAIYKSARKPKLSGLQETRSFTEMGFGPSGKAGCFMPCDLEEDMRVEHYSTPDTESEEGGSEIGSFLDREVLKFKPEVLPQNPDDDASWSEDSTWSDSGEEDTAFGSEEESIKEEEEVSSDDETCVSDGDTSEEPSESDEDVFSDDSGSLTDHETSPVLHTSAKLKFSKASSCSGHLLEGTGVQAAESDVQQYAADGSSVFYEEPAHDQEKNCQSLEGESNSTLGVHSSDSTQLLSNDPNSLKLVDVQLATHNTCQTDTLPTSLSCLFATPQSKIQEATNCSCEPSSTDHQLSSEGAFAENEKGQQSVEKAESRTEFCTPFSALAMDDKENGPVVSIFGSLELSYTDKPVNNNLHQVVESTVKIDGGSKEAATEDARAKTPDICEGVCTEALTEDLGAGKNYPDVFTRTVEDGVATHKQTRAIAVIATKDAGTDTSDNSKEICSQVSNEDFGAGKNYLHTSTRLAEDGTDNNRHAEERFGVEAATTESTTIAVDLKLKGSKYYLSTGDLFQGVECNLDSDITDVAMGSVTACPTVLESGKGTVDSLVKKAESNLCQEESHLELLLCNISDESYAKISSEEQHERNKKTFPSDGTECRNSKVVQHMHVHEGLMNQTQAVQVPQTECSYKELECMSGLANELFGNVWNETQAAQSQQISQTPHLNADGEHMRGLVDELLENVLKAMSQQFAIGLKSETEAVQCAETPQESREDAKGELQRETEAVHAAEVSQSSRADAKGELNKAEVDERLEKILNENITCATCSTCETDDFKFQDISEAHCVAAEGDLIGVPMEELFGAVSKEAEACDNNQLIKELVGDDVSATEILREQSLQHLDLIGAPMEELLGAVSNEAEACDDNQVIKEIVEVDVSATDILREQSLQHLDLTLMSLRKLKQMCQENNFPATTKPVTETPSRGDVNAWMSAKKANISVQPKEVNGWMSAKKANISVQPKDLPSANKRSALKALSSNIKSNTPASSARTPMAKNMQRPRNLMSNYDNSEGRGRNLVAPSPQAPSSSRGDFAKTVRQ
ncbi:hypothetical protein L7F22_014504 [Adiantum nelumboides]|nr:hypothetical protein [Adiantum nelumboides]